MSPEMLKPWISSWLQEHRHHDGGPRRSLGLHWSHHAHQLSKVTEFVNVDAVWWTNWPVILWFPHSSLYKVVPVSTGQLGGDPILLYSLSLTETSWKKKKNSLIGSSCLQTRRTCFRTCCPRWLSSSAGTGAVIHVPSRLKLPHHQGVKL